MAEAPESRPNRFVSPDVESRLRVVAEAYIAQLRAGEAPDRTRFAEAYPDLAGLLIPYRDRIERQFRSEAAQAIGQVGGLPSVEDTVTTPPPPPRGGTESFDAASPTLPDDPDDRIDVPEWIGPYRILEVLGEGGMGTVYMAEQTDTLKRRVALKLIKLGMDTKEVIARFESERQALAVMNHPNIAHVFDAGSTETGRPYFVMEVVQGLPITEYCDTHRLTTSQRLELFEQVCDAVQHAHHKGIIHRDIKPSNVLVTVPSGRPLVKVIDFGVAKATNQRLTERTFYTDHGRLIGTPQYMSPEQAEMPNLEIDHRTDVYSLGIVLYQLLVGVHPFDEKSMRLAGLDEIRRCIREVEPPRPSTRLSQMGEEAVRMALLRRREAELALAEENRRLGLRTRAMESFAALQLERERSAEEIDATIEALLAARKEWPEDAGIVRCLEAARVWRKDLVTGALVGTDEASPEPDDPPEADPGPELPYEASVFLRRGGVLTGQVEHEDEEKIILSYGAGRQTIPRSDIERIEREDAGPALPKTPVEEREEEPGEVDEEYDFQVPARSVGDRRVEMRYLFESPDEARDWELKGAQVIEGGIRLSARGTLSFRTRFTGDVSIRFEVEPAQTGAGALQTQIYTHNVAVPTAKDRDVTLDRDWELPERPRDTEAAPVNIDPGEASWITVERRARMARVSVNHGEPIELGPIHSGLGLVTIRAHGTSFVLRDIVLRGRPRP